MKPLPGGLDANPPVQRRNAALTLALRGPRKQTQSGAWASAWPSGGDATPADGALFLLLSGKAPFRIVVQDTLFEFVVHSLIWVLKISVPWIALEVILVVAGDAPQRACCARAGV